MFFAFHIGIWVLLLFLLYFVFHIISFITYFISISEIKGQKLCSNIRKNGRVRCILNPLTSLLAGNRDTCYFSLSLFFLLTYFFYWRIIALQNFAVFCQTSKWISYRYTYIPCLLKLSPSPSPSHPSRLIQSPCLSFLSHTASSHWPSILHMVR